MDARRLRLGSKTDVLYEGANSQQKISAYYPYIENYTSGGVTFNLTAEQSADTMKADDLLYGSCNRIEQRKDGHQLHAPYDQAERRSDFAGF